MVWKRLGVCAACLILGGPTFADTNQIKTQDPWAYIKRSLGATGRVTYLATTAADEDPDTGSSSPAGREMSSPRR